MRTNHVSKVISSSLHMSLNSLLSADASQKLTRMQTPQLVHISYKSLIIK